MSSRLYCDSEENSSDLQQPYQDTSVDIRYIPSVPKSLWELIIWEHIAQYHAIEYLDLFPKRKENNNVELIANQENIFPRYYTHSNILSFFKSPITEYVVIRCEGILMIPIAATLCLSQMALLTCNELKKAEIFNKNLYLYKCRFTKLTLSRLATHVLDRLRDDLNSLHPWPSSILTHVFINPLSTDNTPQ